jgi:hypothetical protein
MSRPLIIIVGLIYAFVAAEQGARGNAGMAIMYAAYSVGNIGLWMMAGES